MIHYHGTPITPRERLQQMRGRHFCVSHESPRDLETALAIGASVMGDNGAFVRWTRNKPTDWPAYYHWCREWLQHPHWCVVPDVIEGSEEENDALLGECPLPRELTAPVWHLNESLDRLRRLADNYPRICFGSCAEYDDPRSSAWVDRITTAWEVLSRGRTLPWVHMLRAMQQAAEGPWPFASADSTNVARNAVRLKPRHGVMCGEVMADRLDGVNPRKGRVDAR